MASLASVQKRVTDALVLLRRNKLKTTIDRQIDKIGQFRQGKRIVGEQLSVDLTGAIHFRLRFGKRVLKLASGKNWLTSKTLDDLVEQLEQIKTITDMGGLDRALAACTEARRSNCRTAKRKKT